MSVKTTEEVSPKEKEMFEQLIGNEKIWENLKRASQPSFWKRNKTTIFALVLCVFFAAFAGFFMLDSLTVGALAAKDQYSTVKNSIAEATESEFYERSYSFAEKQHHVSNDVSITIGTLQEQAKLEVLTISEVEYVTPDDEEKKNIFETIANTVTGWFKSDVISWLEVPGHGVFTVDLQSAEFIIDNQRQYVLIRVPRPELTNFTIDYSNVQLLKIEDNGLFKNSAKVGEDVAREQLQSAELSMRQNANTNQAFYKSACDSTEKILKTLVAQLNPKLPGLTIDVEFFG